MRNILQLGLVILAVSCIASATDVSCTNLDFDPGTSVCRALTDEGKAVYTLHHLAENGSPVETINEERYDSLMKTDTEYHQKLAAYSKSENEKAEANLRASQFERKKDCLKAGYHWRAGLCHADAQ